MKKEPKQICLEFLKQKHNKRTTMKTPYWEETISRQEKNSKQGVLAYEIYGNKANPTEKETITALNELVTEGKTTTFISYDFVWYAEK